MKTVKDWRCFRIDKCLCINNCCKYGDKLIHLIKVTLNLLKSLFVFCISDSWLSLATNMSINVLFLKCKNVEYHQTHFTSA